MRPLFSVSLMQSLVRGPGDHLERSSERISLITPVITRDSSSSDSPPWITKQARCGFKTPHRAQQPDCVFWILTEWGSMHGHRPMARAHTLSGKLGLVSDSQSEARTVVSLTNHRPGMRPVTQSDHQTNSCRNQSQFRVFMRPKAGFRFHFCSHQSFLRHTWFTRARARHGWEDWGVWN